MINLTHLGYDLHYSYNLTHPDKIDAILCKDDLEAIRMCVLKQPRYMGRVYKKDCPKEPFWKKSDEYFTFYKGRGRINQGDRMVCFYMKEAEIDIHNLDFGEGDHEPLY